jgi:hypothetical protein
MSLPLFAADAAFSLFSVRSIDRARGAGTMARILAQMREAEKSAQGGNATKR